MDERDREQRPDEVDPHLREAWEHIDDYVDRSRGLGFFGQPPGARRRASRMDMDVEGLKAKLERLEQQREAQVRGPRESRWWHSLWPFR